MNLVGHKWFLTWEGGLLAAAEPGIPHGNKDSRGNEN